METETKIKSNYSTPIAIVLAGVIIAGALYFNDGRKPAVPTQPVQDKQVSVDIKNVKTDGDPFIGNPNAPVTIAYWSDYQCPFCKLGEQNAINPLVNEYVKTGKVRVVFKDFAFLGPDSQTIALNARAVWEAYPDKFYEWNKTLFANQGQENTGWATKAVIASLTAKVPGIDQAVIDGLLEKNSVKYQAAIDADKAEAVKFGINGTPGFIIGTQIIPGVPQYPELKALVDSLLK